MTRTWRGLFVSWVISGCGVEFLGSWYEGWGVRVEEWWVRVEGWGMEVDDHMTMGGVGVWMQVPFVARESNAW
jgi:hypothetical protein